MTDISSQTLHIVAKELAATLNDARASLEAYAERPDQRVLLEKCADQLHSAHGVLRLVEVYGAALLAEEMEHVTRYLLSSDNDQKRQVDGLDALMRAMVQLPTYLERVLSGGRDLALVLLPLLNDLRSVRGSPLLSEGTLLLLNLKSDQTGAAAIAERRASNRFRWRNGRGVCGRDSRSACWDTSAANAPCRIWRFWRRSPKSSNRSRPPSRYFSCGGSYRRHPRSGARQRTWKAARR